MPGNARLVVLSVLAGALVVAALVLTLGPEGSPTATTPEVATSTSGPPGAPTTSVGGRVGDGAAVPEVTSDGSNLTVRGRVVWPDGTGPRDVVVTISPADGTASATTTTDRSGSYLLRFPAQWGSGEMLLTATAPAASGAIRGPSTARPVRLSNPADLAPLVLWRGRFGVSDGSASWDPAPAGGLPTLTLSVDDAELLTSNGTATGATFDPILLEDHTAAASASIRTGSGERYTTSVVAVGGPGEPLSRRGPCFFTSDNGVTRVEAPSCGLTDGDFASPDNKGASYRDVIIELGTRRSLSTVVVRGYPSSLRIEVSTDGGVWHPFASGPGWPSPVIFRGDETVVARYVRVIGDEVTYFSTYEISVW